jgi:F-type H+-transporting ATPase subunit gamma
VGRLLDGEISGLEIAYTQHVSPSRQPPVIAGILPLSALPAPQRPPGVLDVVPYEFLPDKDRILAALLPASVRVRVYQCFLEATASEQMARTAAMRSATDNADEMTRRLTRRYNRLRQAQITNELAEIVTGRGARP